MPTPVTDADFAKEVLQSPVPVLVDFWAPWCGPCKAMLPIIEELDKEYAGKVKVVKLNVDDNPESASAHGVMSIPTFIVFVKGQPAKTLVGARSKEDMKAMIDGAIA